MNDWNARLGVLVPSTNNMLERDAHAILPVSVTAHFSRMKYDRDEADPLAALSHHAQTAAELIADAHMDAIAFGCTTGSLLGGLGYDRTIIAMIERVTGTPATTTASAMVEALQATGARRITLVTPYTHALNQKVIRFLESSGIEVENQFGFGIPDPDGIFVIPPEQIVDAVTRTDTSRADAIFLSCTAMRGIDAIGLLRGRVDKPVLSSNQATYWKLARMIGKPKLFQGNTYSHLFETSSAATSPVSLSNTY